MNQTQLKYTSKITKSSTNGLQTYSLVTILQSHGYHQDVCISLTAAGLVDNFSSSSVSRLLIWNLQSTRDFTANERAMDSNIVLVFIGIHLVLHAFCVREVLGECGGHRDSSSGTIESPNYPNGYPVEQNCIWTVAVEGSVKNIKLSFSSFDLQPRSADGECTDYVAVFRKQLKKEAGVVLEARICGSALPDSMQIEESSMTVQFVSDSITGFYSGFSLHYETNFKESSSVSQATAGIVAAVFCAIVFIGVGTLRCIMLGGCNCGGRDLRDNNHNQQVIGHNESYTYQGDFPPSYSTVMHHPERYPTPESSPRAQNSNVPPHQNLNGRTFSVGSSSSSDEDDEDFPPPPYPGNVTQGADGDVNVDDVNTNNSTENGPNTVNNNDEMNTNITEEHSSYPEATTVDVADEDTNSASCDEPNIVSNDDEVTVNLNEEQSREDGVNSHEVPPSEVGVEQSSSTAGTEDIVLDVDTTAHSSQQEGNRENCETSQTGEILEEIESFV